MTNKPIFLAEPRSRSTVLMEMSAYYVDSLNLLPLGKDTEYFNDYTHVCTFSDGSPMELLPFRKASGMTMHYVYPHVFNKSNERIGYKLGVLQQEKEAGREYSIKIMTNNLKPDIVDFFADRTFIITKRDDTVGQIMSLVFAKVTNLWHKRSRNESVYESITPFNVGDITLRESIREVLISKQLLHAALEDLAKKNIKFHLFDYDDLKTERQRISALNSAFEKQNWPVQTPGQETQNIRLDYTTIFNNYPEVLEKIQNNLK